MEFKGFRLAFAISCFFFTFDRSSSYAQELSILSPTSSIIQTESILLTIEVDGKGLNKLAARIALPEPFEIQGKRSADKFYIFHIPTMFNQSIEIVAETADGRQLSKTLDISVSQWAVHPVALLLDRSHVTVSNGSINATTTLNPLLGKATEMLIDYEGDGKIDTVLPYHKIIEFTLKNPGIFKPMITLRTSNNLLFSSWSEKEGMVHVERKPSTAQEFITDVGSIPVDMLYDYNNAHLLFLFKKEAIIRRFSMEGEKVDEIIIPGGLSPEAIDVDRAGNIYVADTGNNRAVRLLAANGFRLDTSFSIGSHINAPSDIACNRDTCDVIAVAEPSAGTIVLLYPKENRMLRLQKDLKGPLGFTRPQTVSGLGMGFLVGDAATHKFMTVGDSGKYFREDDRAGPFMGQINWDGSSGDFVAVDAAKSQVTIRSGWGAILREFSTSEYEPLDALIVYDKGLRKVFVTYSNSARIDFFPLYHESGPDSPVAVVKKFNAILLKGDISALKELVTPRFERDFMQRLMDPATLRRVQEELKKVGALKLESESRVFAMVVEQTAGQFQFNLEREIASGQWKVASFF